MLEAGIHQAASLCALAGPTAPRIVALAGHGDKASELPLLWQLCSTWTELDYPVVVLDATANESTREPGLQQLLRDPEEFNHLQRGPQPWLIVPAARGLVELAHDAQYGSNAERVRHLGELFHGHEIVLLYAPAEALATVLNDSGVSPLLGLSTDPAALLSAYQALKALLNIGGLRPTIAVVMDHPAAHSQAAGHGHSLQACAREFLACELPLQQICLQRPLEARQLAMRVLECAPAPAPADPIAARSQ